MLICRLPSYPLDYSCSFTHHKVMEQYVCLFPVLRTDGGSDTITVSLPLYTTSNVQGFCTGAGVTPSRIFQLAWSIILRTYVSVDQPCFYYQDDCVNGVCRVDLSEDHPVLQLLQELETRSLEAPTRTAGAHINTTMGLGSNTHRADTDIHITVDVDEWTISLSSRTLLSADQALQVADAFAFVLGQLTKVSHLSSVECCSPQSIQQLERWNEDEPEYVDGRIHDSILGHCERCPEAPAICAWDGDFTYGEIDRLSREIAKSLLLSGVGHDKFVGIYFDKSKWTPVLTLGILRAGAAFVFLDPSFPEERLRHMCQQANVSTIITADHLRERASGLGPSVLPIGGSLVEVTTAQAMPEMKTNANVAAYISFTSGSTGTPKGAVVNHSSFVSGQRAILEFFRLRPEHRVLQFAAHAFDMCIWEHLAPLMAGACICIPSEEARTTDLAGAARQIGANFFTLTPTVARFLRVSDVPCLEILVLIGEPPSSSDVTTWAGHCRLINGYGPGECSVLTSAHEFEPGDEHHPTVIGRGFGARCWVTDPTNINRLLPVGAVGELIIEGPIVGRGYVNDPTKNSESFVESPPWRKDFPGNPRGPLYRTGDLVQYVSGGELRCLGRNDAQAKLRGQRLDMGEVEHGLHRVFGEAQVTLAEIIVPRDANGTRTLIGFVLLPGSGEKEGMFSQPRPHFRSLAQAAISKLKETLPSYMVPFVIVELASSPTTKTGKADRRRLRTEAEKLSRAELESFTRDVVERRLPLSPMEHTLSGLVRDVLGVEVGMNDNFFHLGGNSLLAMELSRTSREKGVQLTTQAIFKHPTLADLALSMLEAPEVQEDVPAFSLVTGHKDILKEAQRACALPREEIEDIYPCTPLQEAMMASSMAGDGTTYVIRNVYRLPRAIDSDRLQRAWSAVVLSNPSLRTRVVQLSVDQALQAVVRGDVAWEHFSTLQEAVDQDMRRPMRLGQPLLRLKLVQSRDARFMVLTIHHALCDGWSLRQTLAQVEAAYYGASPASRPFKLFIRHQTGLDEEVMNAFWSTQLDGFSETHFPNLPSNSYRPTNVKMVKKSIRNVKLPDGLQTTIATILQLGWAMTLSQYSGSDDVVFGSTVSGRNAPVDGIGDILGPTLATIPVRVKLPRDRTVRDAIQHVHNQNSQAIPFESLGLRKIAALGGGCAAACRFQSLLIIQPQDVEGASTIFGNKVEEASSEIVGNYMITLEATTDDGLVRLVAEHDADLISTDLMTMILCQFAQNIEEVTSSLDNPIGDLGQASASDLRLVHRWNSHVPEAIECCIHDFFSRHAIARPTAPAVEAWDGHLTYAELDDSAMILAARLQAIGAGLGQYILIHAGKSKRTVISMLAVLKAGAAFVLIDPAQPLSRLRQICSDTRASLIIASKQYWSQASALGLDMLKASDDDTLALEPFQEPAVAPGDLAYAVFTSGSTGRPKGVQIQHRAFLTSAVINGGKQHITRESRVMQLASFTFDSAIAEILYTLVHGGCVCMPSELESRNNIERAMNDYRATWATLTPSLARALDPSKLTTLRHLALGGEAMKKSDIDMWADRVLLGNGYGPSESSVDALVQPDVRPGCDPSNIGCSYAGAAWIVDPRDHGRLVPIGAVGELLLEGPTLALGYLDDPKKTEASFVQCPGWLAKLGRGSRLYKTGDLVQYDAAMDGSIRYLGRKDNQVKIRGQRIELAEVEHHLQECVQGAKAIIAEVVTPSGGAEPLLAAFVLLDTTAAPSEDFLTSVEPSAWLVVESAEVLLRDRVPNYMIPGVFLPLSRVPVNANGKTDRRVLKDEASKRTIKELRSFSLSSSSLPSKRLPEMVEEVILCQCLSTLLKIPTREMSIEDNFFHLGGDSIIAMKLVALVREKGYVVSVADIFTCPHLAGLSRCLVRTKPIEIQPMSPFSLIQKRDASINAAAEQCGVDATLVEDVYPVTPMQEALLASSMKQKGSYIANISLHASKDVDVDQLRVAWGAVYKANAILRTRFILGPSGQLLQVVLRDHLQWSSDDSPLEINYGQPCMKLCLMAQGDVQLDMHHALYDGASLSYIFDQVAAAYRGEVLKPGSFNRFVASTLKQSRTEYSQFWQEEFADAEMAMFPTQQRPKSSEHTRQTISEIFALSETAESSFTLPTTIYLASAVVFGHYVMSDDVVYGLTLAGIKEDLNMDDIGPTVTTVPLRVKFDSTKSVADNLANVRDHLLRIGPYEQTGLQNISSISPETAAACNFNCHVVVQPADEAMTDGLFSEARTRDQSSDFASYPLVLIYDLSADRKTVRVTANADPLYLMEEELTRLLHQLHHVLQQTFRDHAAPLSSIQVASPRDMTDLRRLNQAVPFAVDRLLHEIVYEQCRLYPGKTAVSSWDGSFSYTALRKNSAKLSAHLIISGVAPRDITIVCMEKSCWTIVAILAVLETGSACAVVDSSHPRARIQEIINQTGAKHVIVSPTTGNIVPLSTRTVVTRELINSLNPPEAVRVSCANPTDPALIFFTSGSTGRPKGIVLEHRALATSLCHLQGLFSMKDLRVLHFVSYAFDIAMLEVFQALTTGGCLCIPSETERTTGLIEFIRREQVNFSAIAASAARLLRHPSEVPSLKMLMVGGEPLSPSDAALWSGSLRLIHGYAPAECSFVCAGSQLSYTQWTPGTIGPALTSCCWITDPSDPGKLVAWGAVGELLVEGHVLARGYLDAEQTSVNFIPCPSWLTEFRGANETRLYRTGDLVHYTPKGEIRFVGRKDSQVKLRGQRIELGEVESQIQGCLPSGSTVIAAIVPSNRGAQKLFAFIHLVEEASVNYGRDTPVIVPPSDNIPFRSLCRKVTSRLSAVVPSYMIPDEYMQLNYIPETGSGKIDRRRLVKLASAASTGMSSPRDRTGRPPSTQAEKALADLWMQELGCQAGEVGACDNFFQLGGDSIHAMKLAAAARKQNMQLTVSNIFSSPLLEDMALVATKGTAGARVAIVDILPFSLLEQPSLSTITAAASRQCGITPDIIEDIYPCTPFQEGLISQSMRRDAGSFVGSFRFRLPSSIHLERFQEAWQMTAEANPILRTRFIQAESSLFQVVVAGKLECKVEMHLDDYSTPLESEPLRFGQELVHPIILQVGNSRDFLLVMHHALYDAWSLDLLLSQVLFRYETRQIRPLPPYSRFVHDVRERVDSSKQYWSDHLSGSPGIKFPCLPSHSYQPLTDSVLKRSVDLKPVHGVTGAVILQLAWAWVLSQHTDTNDVIFGLILSGRTADLEDIESIVGPLVTTVPMRFKLDRNGQVDVELRRLQDQLSSMVAHEQFGLRNIKSLGGDAIAACSFQNLLLIQPATTSTEQGYLWADAVEQPRNAGDFSTYALEVTCEMSESSANITMDFDSSVLEPREVQRILDQYAHAIDQIQMPGSVSLSHLNLLSESARDEIMGWNSTIPRAVQQCVHDGIVKKCAETPGAQAVSAWDGDFTYQELDDLSFRLAVRLQGLGVGPEIFVPVLAEKSRWVAIAILGIVRAGGAIVLLDPSVPFERLKTICLTVGASIIVTNSQFCREVASQLVSKVVDVSDVQTYEMNGVVDINRNVRPQDALYAIFTSGSTGKPKGIVVEHSAFFTSGLEQQRPLRIDAETRTLQFASHMFDVSVADYLWTFLAGGCVCVASNDMLRDDLKGAINQLGVNRADLTPSVARVLRPQDIPTVKTILLGGEPMSQKDIETWAGRVQLVNGYGPSECSVCCILADVDVQSDPSNIGYAYGIVPWIVDKDDHNRLMPIGGIGELVLEGPSLARGYLGDTGKAASAFLEEVPSWLRSKRSQSRLYKTGDLVQYNPDGTIRYIGRKDTQVKIRGQRVELGEIEQQIRQSRSSFRDVVVELLSVGSQSTDKFLAAFVYAEQDQRNGQAPSSLFCDPSARYREEFRSVMLELELILPSYMVPTLFIPLKVLPLSPTGKADRRRLAEGARALSPKVLEGYKTALLEKRQPTTNEEQRLQSVVAEVLRRSPEDIGMDDDFFGLGGDSIIALHFVECARQTGFSFRVTTVFKTPKLSELARHVLETANGLTQRNASNPFAKFGLPSKDEASKINRWSSHIVDVLPVSQSTERYLFVPPEYWIVNLEGSVDFKKLQSACNSLTQRHGVLRSVFSKHGDTYCQFVLDRLGTNIIRHHTSLTVFDFIDQCRRNDDIPVPSLDQPITQFLFVQNDAGDQALAVRLSHAQFDGYCLHTMWHDLKCLYEDAMLPPPTDYAEHMKQWAEDQTEDAFAYWRKTLQGSNIAKIDNLTLTKGYTNGKVTGRGRFVTATACAKVRASSPQLVTMATVAKTAWACTLAQLTGQNDVVFTQAVNGRSGTDTCKNVVGLCLNFSPVRVQLRPPQRALDLMMSVQQQHQESLEHELLDFRDIVKQSTPWPEGTTHQSMLVHQNIDPDLPFAFGEARAHVTCSYHWEHPPDDILIESKLLDDREGLQLTLDTTTGTLSQASAERVLGVLCQWVEALVGQPEGKIGDCLSLD